MNNNQKTVFIIFWAMTFFFISVKVAGVVGQENIGNLLNMRTVEHPFDFEKTWWVWALYSTFIGLIAVLLFSDSKSREPSS